MKLPGLEHPDRYAGLYIVDFGETVSVGYTAEEVAMLLDSQAYADVTVYRIHSAAPDGTLEIKGVSRDRFAAETSVLLHHRDLPAARRQYDRLAAAAEETPLPCRTQLLLAAAPEGSRLPYVVALAYPAEYDDDVARWMIDNDVREGEYADGGVARTDAFRRNARVIDSRQLHAARRRRARSRREVLAAVGEPIQRTA